MAFLCPVRIKRSKKKKPLHDDSLPGVGGGPAAPSMGRITGSASIETLVRVGIEKENGLGPEAKMVVLHDFTPCVDDELEVKRGQVVHVLYQENDWVYVISEENREGFIPHSYCAQYGSQMATLALNVRKKLPRVETQPAPDPGASGGGGPGKATSMNGLPTTAAMAQLQFQQQQQQQQQQQRHPNASGSTATDGGVNITGPSPSSAATAANTTATSAGSKDSSTGVGVGVGVSVAGVLRPIVGSGRNANISVQRPGPSGSVSPPGAGNDPPSGTRSNSLMSETTSGGSDVVPFYKESSGRYVVLYPYSAQDENDLQVERGQCVTVLNSEDPDWYWVSRYDGCEGFVPSGFIYPLDAIQRQQNLNSNNNFRPPPLQHQSAPFQQQPLPQQPHFPQQQSQQQLHSHHHQQQQQQPQVFQQHQQAQPQQPSFRTGGSSNMNSTSSVGGGPSFTSTPSSANQHNNNFQQHPPPSSGYLPYVPPQQQQQQQQQHPPPTFPPLGSAGGSSGPSSYSTTATTSPSAAAAAAAAAATAAVAIPPGANVNGLPTVAPPPQGSGSTTGSAAANTAQHTGGQGFSPQQQQQWQRPQQQQQQQQQQQSSVNGDGRYHGTEMVMLYDYKAQAPDDLSVRRGDYVYADLSNQTVDGWLWSFSPRAGKYGFIPKAYARPPAMTSL